MKYSACDITEFIRRTEGKEVVCWGAGYWLTHFCNMHKKGVERNFSYVVDKNPEIWGTIKTVGCKKLEVYSPQYLYDSVSSNTVLLITFDAFRSLYEELDANPKFNDVECFASVIINAYESDNITYSVPPVPKGYRMNETIQIPKTIHYIWFGDSPVPDKFKPYIESWYKYCPDYEIKEWNESNYDILTHPFMRETTAANRPGFTADYARLDIIYRYGGIYLDVDVELLRNIDELLFCSAFCGFQDANYIALGLGFGASMNHPMIRAFRDDYDSLTFTRMENPKSMIKYTASPEIQTKKMQEFGLQQNGELQIINDMTVFPAIYLNPLSRKTNRYFGRSSTYSIHHFAASWLTEDEREKHLSYLNSGIRFAPTNMILE